jgi:hypothetical protein
MLRKIGHLSDEPNHTLAIRSPVILSLVRSCAAMLCIQPMEDLMPIQVVMDVTGDTRHDFDLNDETAVAEARKRFNELTDAGFIAAKRTGSGASELVRRFDPTVQETLFFPRLIGG